MLGVTGGIAAYKAAELTRLLVKAGAEVEVVMTAAAKRFVTPLTFQALSGRPVLTAVAIRRGDAHGTHLPVARRRRVVVAPASADFLAKLAQGHADDLLSTLCLARECPLLVAPAMNRQMWADAATQRNVAQLGADGVDVLGPPRANWRASETATGACWRPPRSSRRCWRLLQPKVLAASAC